MATEERTTRADGLSSAVSRIRSRGAFDFGRAQLFVGGGLALVGLLTIFLGWWAAARTPFLFEQVPYLISGGLLGLALAFLGGFLYFAYWVTRLLDETRSQAERTNELLSDLNEHLGGASANGSGSSRFVVTATGSQFHLPDCPVVSGKQVKTLRSPGDRDPCKVCDPLSA